MKKSEQEDIENFYKEKYAFIHDLIKHFPRPESTGEQDDSDDDEENVQVQTEIINLPKRLFPAVKNNKKQATTIEELQAKLTALKGKSKLPYKEKLLKKGLKNRLKKKEKKEERKIKRHMNKEKKIKLENNPSATKQKPVYNSEGQMIFSKFDFSELGTKQTDIKVPVIKDPQVALKKIKEEEKKLKELKEAGEIDKVKKIVEKKAVKAALLKSEGVKIKDDPELLKKAIMKKKMQKHKSAKKWEARKNQVEKLKEAKQKKRTENIQKKMKEKKGHKLKKLAKKGRIIL